MADRAGPRAVRLERAGGGRARDRPGRADDLRDLPDDALPPRRRRAEGGDAGSAVRGAVHASVSAAARTSTSTRSATAGRRSRPVRRCSRRRWRSSARCSAATWSPTAASTSPSTPRGCGICPMSRSGSPSRSPATERRALRAAGGRPHRGRAGRRRSSRGGTASTDVERRSARGPRHRAGADLLGPRREAAVERAHEQFRWFGGGWDVNADLPTTAGFGAASHALRAEDDLDRPVLLLLEGGVGVRRLVQREVVGREATRRRARPRPGRAARGCRRSSGARWPVPSGPGPACRTSGTSAAGRRRRRRPRTTETVPPRRTASNDVVSASSRSTPALSISGSASSSGNMPDQLLDRLDASGSVRLHARPRRSLRRRRDRRSGRGPRRPGLDPSSPVMSSGLDAAARAPAAAARRPGRSR